MYTIPHAVHIVEPGFKNIWKGKQREHTEHDNKEFDTSRCKRPIVSEYGVVMHVQSATIGCFLACES